MVVETWVALTQICKVPRLSGRYSSYLLPRQNGGTPQISVNATQVLDHHGHPVHSRYLWTHLTAEVA